MEIMEKVKSKRWEPGSIEDRPVWGQSFSIGRIISWDSGIAESLKALDMSTSVTVIIAQ